MSRPTYDHTLRRITDKSLTNRAIDLRSRWWSYEQIWSQQGRWSCSKLRTRDYKSQEIANSPYMIARPVVQGRTINRAWSRVDKSRDRDDWLHDFILVVQLVVICWWFHFKGTRFWNSIRHFCDPRSSKLSSINYCFWPGLVKFAPNLM